MLPVKLHDLGSVSDSELTRVVCVCMYNGKWVYSKHKERKTWEIPGGHIEEGETWLEAAKRELYEETGAIEVEIEPICLYSISTYALLCYANIKKFEKLPDFDDINILNATKLGMKKALESLKIKPDIVLVDAVKIDTEIKQENIIKRR